MDLMDFRFKNSNRIEDGMVLTIVLLATLMLYWSFDYGDDTALFPQIMSTMVIAVGLFILVSNNIQIFSANKKNEGLDVMDSITEEKERGGYAIDPEIDMEELYLISITTIYLLISVLLGVMWGTIVFMLLYSKWKNFKVSTTIVYTIVCMIVVYLLMIYVNVDMTGGYLFGGI